MTSTALKSLPNTYFTPTPPLLIEPRRPYLTGRACLPLSQGHSLTLKSTKKRLMKTVNNMSTGNAQKASSVLLGRRKMKCLQGEGRGGGEDQVGRALQDKVPEGRRGGTSSVLLGVSG